tara:strand:+ start:192 stop:617 length:426 start_codon:yes stop_codon:yes gene_type:complete
MDSKDQQECPICYEKISEDDMETLSCGHKFHYECILATFRAAPITYENKNRECPYCRIQSKHLTLRLGTLPIKNIHREYDELKGKNIKVETLDKYLVKTQCKAILKTGVNKGNQCSRKIHENGFCKIHSKKPVATYMYFSV